VRFADDRVTANQRPHHGIDPKIDPGSRLVAVQAEVTDAQGRVRPGSFLRVRVDLPAEGTSSPCLRARSCRASMATTSSLSDAGSETAQRRQQEGAVERMQPRRGSVAQQRFVTVGRRDGARVEIVRGSRPASAL